MEEEFNKLSAIIARQLTTIKKYAVPRENWDGNEEELLGALMVLNTFLCRMIIVMNEKNSDPCLIDKVSDMSRAINDIEYAVVNGDETKSLITYLLKNFRIRLKYEKEDDAPKSDTPKEPSIQDMLDDIQKDVPDFESDGPELPPGVF